MKAIHLIVALFCFGGSVFASDLTPVPAEGLFVPRGFDDNDDIVVTLDGYLPSPCYQLAQAQITRDLEHGRIYVQPMARVVGTLCPAVIVPYIQSVSLGRFARGTYRVITGDGKQNQPLVVERAPIPTKDDYLYAPVDTAQVAPYGSGYVAVLTGRFTNSCLRMRAIPVTSSGRTLQVLPIMELTKVDAAGRPCRRVETPFRVTQRLPSLHSGRYLLHVRSLNGQSINTVFSIQ